jgi:hypothetical protein
MYEMVKTEALSFRVAADTKAALERAAAADERSISNLVEKVLREWLSKRGYLAPEAPKAAARRR